MASNVFNNEKWKIVTPILLTALGALNTLHVLALVQVLTDYRLLRTQIVEQRYEIHNEIKEIKSLIENMNTRLTERIHTIESWKAVTHNDRFRKEDAVALEKDIKEWTTQNFPPPKLEYIMETHTRQITNLEEKFKDLERGVKK